MTNGVTTPLTQNGGWLLLFQPRLNHGLGFGSVRRGLVPITMNFTHDLLPQLATDTFNYRPEEDIL